MKFSGKKVVALIIALMMCSAMVTSFATETTPSIDITSVKILNSASEPGTEVADLSNVSLTAEQMLQVTATVANVENAQISFMSYANGAAAYTDSTIQYLDQKPAVDNAATFTFRPRLTTGAFVAMTGATEVTVADSFNYTVIEAKADMTVTGSVTYPANTIVDTILTIDAVINEIASVKIGSTVLTAETDYTVATGETTTAVTIKAAAIPTEVGTYTVTISADGYNDGTATIKINHADVVIPDEDIENAQTQLDIAVESLETVNKEEDGGYTIDISDKNVTVGEEQMTVIFTASNKSAGITEEGGKLKFTPAADTPFVGKATVTATLASNVTVVKDVYFIPEGTAIGFGNVTALDNNLADAFKPTGTDEEKKAAFTEWVGSNQSAVKAAKDIALAVAAGRTDKSAIAQASQTLSFDGDDVITLNEYNIYRKMVEGFDGYDIVIVNNQRKTLYGVE